jgi:DNA-binding transcriptional LysR family regulator
LIAGGRQKGVIADQPGLKIRRYGCVVQFALFGDRLNLRLTLGRTGCSIEQINSYPMASHFDLVDVTLFVSIAEKNTLTHGAESCHMSLAAASKRIKNLEDSLKVKLLYRNSQGVTLAPAGRAFLHYGRLLLQQLERMESVLQEHSKGLTGHVRVFANTTAVTDFLPQVLRKYLVTHPDVNVDLREGMSMEIIRAVRQGETDIGIAAGYVGAEGLEVFPYRRDRLVLATAQNHSLARRRTISFEKTLEFDYIGVEASAIQSFAMLAAEELQRSLRVRIQVGNFEELCRMIEANVGIGILPESAARRHRATMGVRIVQLKDAWATHNLQICVRRLRSLPTFARDLVGLLVADAASDNRFARPEISIRTTERHSRDRER